MQSKNTRIDIVNSQAIEEGMRKFSKETRSDLIAPLVGQTRNTWLDSLNPDRDTHRLCFIRAGLATVHSGNTSLLEGLCAFAGYGIHKLEQAKTDNSPLHLIFKSVSNSGHITSLYEKAMHDEVITEQEAHELIEAADKAQATLNELRHVLTNRCKTA